jgi:bifunctional isochorismate lyase/aryl carrier protein
VGLPTIQPYPLPIERELPPTRVTWRLARARAALLVHDMQRYFAAPFPPDEAPLAPVTTHIARIREACHAHGVPVFYTAQRGGQRRETRGLQADFWGPGMTVDPAHAAIVDALSPVRGDVVLEKHRYSAFQRGDFADRLRAAGRDQLVVTGIYAHIGCLLTAADAFMRDVEPFVVADAVADFSRRDHDAALAYVAGCCGAVTTTARVVAALTQEPS